MNSKRRVVVTGLGMITPYGVGVEAFWSSMLQGKSAITKIEGMNLQGQSVLIAGEIKNFEQMGLIDHKEARRTDRYNQLAMVALDEAMKSAGLEENNFEDPYRVGVVVGSGVGGFDTFEKQHHVILERGPTKCTPFTIPMIINDMAAGRISIKIGARGINKAVISACATSNHCIGDSFRSIQWGEADIMIAGGAESVITPLGIGAFTSLRALSKRNDEPERASRPFDKDRDGFVMSEGSALLVLEELEHAKKRGATIYAEIIGYGQSADAYDIVAPDPEGKGSAKAMEFALKDANIKPEDIGYINTHGTSTGLGDISESQAIARIFGDREVNKKLKVSSTKSMHGHLLGATGACEAVVCIKAMADSKVPPTINLDNPDPEVANLDYVPHKAVEAELDYTLSNSFGFGGHNTSLVFKKYNG